MLLLVERYLAEVGGNCNFGGQQQACQVLAPLSGVGRCAQRSFFRKLSMKLINSVLSFQSCLKRLRGQSLAVGLQSDKGGRVPVKTVVALECELKFAYRIKSNSYPSTRSTSVLGTVTLGFPGFALCSTLRT